MIFLLIFICFFSLSHGQGDFTDIDTDNIGFGASVGLLTLFCCCCVCASVLLFGYTSFSAFDCILKRGQNQYNPNDQIIDAAIIPENDGRPIIETTFPVKRVRNKMILFPPPASIQETEENQILQSTI